MVALNNTYKILGAVFVFLILISTAAVSTPLLKDRQINSYSKNIVHHTSIIKDGWPQIYNGKSEDFALNMVIDSKDNVIVTGYSAQGSYANTYTIKYDSSGNELWNASYDSGTHDVGFFLAVDSNDNIFVLGYFGKLPISDGDCFIIKYSSDGVEQWNYTFAFDECDYPGGIAIDNYDNIIITGGSGDWQSNMYYWAIKFDENCIEQWNHTFHESSIDIGLGVAVDSENNIITTGISAVPFADYVFLIKYSEDGSVIWEKRRPGNEPWDIAIDSKDSMIVTGTGYNGQTLTMFTIKCDKEGTLLWTAEYDSGVYDGGRSVAVDSNDNIIVGGFSGYSQDDHFEHCALVYNQDGNELCMKREGIEGYIYGVAVDSSDSVYITGAIEEGIYGYYTTKYTDLIPPDIKFKKPKDQFLHILGVPILPLPKRTIAIGKLNIILHSEDPADIEYIELYIDNQLKETYTNTPYEWKWDNSTFGMHSIKAIAYDISGCAYRSEISIFKIF